MLDRSTAFPAMVAALAVACGGEQAASEQMAETMETPPSPPAMVASGDIDQALATQGETLYQTRGCIGCHTIGGGRLTGPDLQGVTERRSPDWFTAMVVNPDSMLKNDSEAKKLLAEYMTPMLSMGVKQDEARAIYEYLRLKQ